MAEKERKAVEKAALDVRSDPIVIKNGWLMCPQCGKMKVLRLEAETTAHALPVYCRRCRQESIVNIEPRLSPCRAIDQRLSQ